MSMQASTAANDLSFSGSSFSQLPNGMSTTGGKLDFGLGSFTLTNNTSSWIDTDFYSSINFTLPVAISPAQSTSAFHAEVLGVVKKDLFGAVYIDFDTSPQHFTFQNSQYAGSFDFNVSELLFGTVGSGPGKPVTWTGHVTNAVQAAKTSNVPEPSSVLLLGSGLLWVAGLRRRRVR